jgi:hypothetical protein
MYNLINLLTLMGLKRQVFMQGKSCRCRISRERLILAFILFMVLLPFQQSEAGTNNAVVPVTAKVSRVSGIIYDENAEAMIGVSVKIKGKPVGTISDTKGKFTLDIPDGATVIEVSYIGYKTQSVSITGENLVIRMEPDTKTLDDVVVIGYGTVK